MTLPSTKYDDSASPPSDGPQPGTMALRTACLERYPRLSDLGIYVRRPVRGGSAPSKHSQGRAWDAECHDQAYGRAVFDYLVAHHAALGIQVVIWWHRIWSVPRGEHAYTGTDPHTGHLHIEQNWDGAEYLTYAAASRVLWAQPPEHPLPQPSQEDDDVPWIANPVTDDDPGQYLIVGNKRVPLASTDESNQLHNSTFLTHDVEPLAWDLICATTVEVDHP